MATQRVGPEGLVRTRRASGRSPLRRIIVAVGLVALIATLASFDRVGDGAARPRAAVADAQATRPSTTAEREAPPPEPPRFVPRTFVLHYNDGPVDPEVARGRDYVVLNAWEAGVIPALRAVNPSVRVLAYKDLVSTRDYERDPDHVAGGVRYETTEANPEWYLRDRQGRVQEYRGYPGHVALDPGNPGYRQAWTDGVLADLGGRGFDGVLIDNVLADPVEAYGLDSALYADAPAWQRATAGMLGEVVPRLHAAGLVAFANVQEPRAYPEAWRAYLPILDGALIEFWAANSTETGEGRFGEAEGWRVLAEELTFAEGLGKPVLARTQGILDDLEAMRYGLGSLLLVTNGSSLFSFSCANCYDGGGTPRFPEYEIDLGAPVGAVSELAPGLFRRDFLRGAVLVNITDAPAFLEVGEGYETLEAVPTRSALIAPRSATLLRCAASSCGGARGPDPKSGDPAAVP